MAEAGMANACTKLNSHLCKNICNKKLRKHNSNLDCTRHYAGKPNVRQSGKTCLVANHMLLNLTKQQQQQQPTLTCKEPAGSRGALLLRSSTSFLHDDGGKRGQDLENLMLIFSNLAHELGGVILGSKLKTIHTTCKDGSLDGRADKNGGPGQGPQDKGTRLESADWHFQESPPWIFSKQCHRAKQDGRRDHQQGPHDTRSQ